MKYVIIFINQDNTVWKVIKVRNKQDLRDLTSFYVDEYIGFLICKIEIFEYSDSTIIQNARKCENIINYRLHLTKLKD